MRLAAATLAVAAFASCERENTSGPDHTDPEPLENAIYFDGTVTDIKTVLEDEATGTLWLCAEEGVTTLGEIEGTEYVRIIMGEGESDDNTYRIDLKAAPAGFSLLYSKEGETAVEVSAEDNSAISEGSLSLTLNGENSATIDFRMTLTDGKAFSGNALWSGLTMAPEELSYPEKANTIVVNGTETAVGTAFADSYEGSVLITAGLTATDSYDELLAGDFVQTMMLPQFLNQEINLKEELITIYYTLQNLTAAPLTSDMLDEGKVRIDMDEESGECSLLLAIRLNDGTEIGVNATATLSDPTPEEGNTITVDNATEPVRAAFYMDMAMEGTNYVYLYFTASEVYYLDEMLELATGYFCLAMNEDDLTGNEIDLTSTDKYFYLAYMDQMTGEMSYAMQGDSEGTTGTMSVSRSDSDPASFTAEISVTFGDGKEVAVSFDGTAVSGDYVPEEPNEFTYDGTTEAIQSVLVDKSDAVLWHIYVSEVGGLEYVSEFEDMGAIHISIPAEAVNGEAAGFSTYKDMKIEFSGNTWQFPDTGTVTVSLEGDQIVLDFTTYGDLIGHYSGTVTVIE